MAQHTHMADPTRAVMPVVGGSGPEGVDTMRLDPAERDRQLAALTRRRWIIVGPYAVVIVLLLTFVAWFVAWQLWPALIIVAFLAGMFGRQMYLLGRRAQTLDERARIMGVWQIHGRTPTGDPLTLIGHMAYSTSVDIGRLNRLVRVDLDTTDAADGDD